MGDASRWGQPWNGDPKNHPLGLEGWALVLSWVGMKGWKKLWPCLSRCVEAPVVATVAGAVVREARIRHLRNHHNFLANHKGNRRCDECELILPDHCLCERLGPLRVDRGELRHPNVKFVLLTHITERFIQRNSGKILSMVLPNCEVEVLEDDSDLATRLASWGRTMVLYPCASAVPMTPEIPTQADTLIIIDSTWQQAKRIGRKIPAEFQRVSLDPSAPSLREQTAEGRLSTIEAAALVLAEAGEPKSVVDRVWEAARLHTAAVIERKPNMQQDDEARRVKRDEKRREAVQRRRQKRGLSPLPDPE
mmetsp:Transcript_34697/g.79332  ORF Transcript_34697/g.79332 Transcript_34697/m.79332 type:complete len:307 (-) Transcript_34697:448-1368(-)